MVEENQVVAFYPGIEAGQMVAIAKDPLLLNWEKIEGNPGHTSPVRPGIRAFGRKATPISAWWAPTAWSHRRTWSTGQFTARFWKPIHSHRRRVACPTFLPIGDKHILLSFSHTGGGQYLLGDYDRQRHRFTAL